MKDSGTSVEVPSNTSATGTMTAPQINELLFSIMQNMNLTNTHAQNLLRPQDIGYFLLDNDAKDEVEFTDGKQCTTMSLILLLELKPK